MKKYCSLLLFSLFSVLIAGCARHSGSIKIGVAVPLTGPQSAIGRDVANAVKLAADEFNSKDGSEIKIEVTAYDDQSQVKEAANVANKLASDPECFAVIGHLVSGCSLPASEIYARAALAMVTPSSTNPQLTLRGLKNIFRTCPVDDVLGAGAGEFAVRKLHKKTFAVLHDKTAYGQGVAEEFRKSVLANGGKVLSFEGVSQGELDYSAVLTKVKDLNPEVLYFGGMYPEGALIAKQMNSLNLKSVLFSADGLYVPEYIRLAEKAAEGTVITFVAPPYDQVAGAKDFVDKYNKKYGEVKIYAPYAYDAANIIINAIAAAAKSEGAGKLSRAKVIENISKTKEYRGVTGVISFDSKGDVIGKQVYFYRVENGKFVWIR